MTIVQILAEVLADAAKSEEIPNVRFKLNNDLGEEVIKIAGGADTQPSDESDEECVNRLVAEIVGAVDPETGKAGSLEGVDFINAVAEKVSDLVASKMKATTDKLRIIHGEVSNLSDNIKNKYNTILAADPFLAKYAAEDSEVFLSFPKMRYDALNDLGGIKNTVAYVISEADSDEKAMSVPSKFINVIGKFAARKLKVDELTSVELPVAKRKEIVAKVNQENSEFIESNLEDVAKVMVSAQSLKALTNRLISTFEKDTPMVCTTTGLSVISDYRKACSVLATAMDAEGITIPEYTLQFINDLTDLCGYVVQFHRVNTFATTVLFKDKSLNPDMEKELNSKSLTIQDVAQHVQHRYRDFELPGTGISIDSLEQNKERIDKEVKDSESKNKVKINAGLHDATHKAFVGTMMDYLAQDLFSQQLGDVGDLRSYIVSCANKITNEGMSCEDTIYVIMENLLYKNDFVMVLREHLGMDYVKAVASNKELSADKIAEVNATVYARLITEWMKIQFMEEG